MNYLFEYDYTVFIEPIIFLELLYDAKLSQTSYQTK